MNGWDDPATSLTGPSEALDGELLGRGGEGVVVSGRDRRLPREVAWKLASPDDPAGARRLEREARLLARLDHPSIVPVYDLVRSDDGTLRLALRQIHGQTLRQAIADRAASQRLGLLPHVLAAAHAIAWAHGEGIIHRDLNAANVMIGRFGETQVIDWGLACETHDARPELVGTPRTMSPEQARGESATPRSDLWGLGTLLHEVLTGTPLTPGLTDTESLLAARRTTPLPPIAADAPPALIAIAARALAHDPEARYPDAESLAADLAAYLEGRLVSAHRYSTRELFARFIRTFRVPLLLGLATLVITAVAGIIAYQRIAKERDETARAHEATRKALIDADLANAKSALDDDYRAEAELAAARVISLADNPEARGILAALGRSPAPRLESRVPLFTGHCTGADLSPSGRRLACYGDGSVTVYGSRGEVVRQWTTLPRSVRFIDEDHLAVSHATGLLFFDLLGHTSDTPRSPRRFPACGGELVGGPHGLADAVTECAARIPPTTPPSVDPIVRPCDGESVQAVAPLVSGLVALCPDGRLIVDRTGEPRRVIPTALTSPIGNHRALAEVPGEDALLVGTARGDLMRLSLADGTVEAHIQVRPDRLIRWLDIRPPLVLVHIDGNIPVLHHARSLAEVARFPLTEERAWWLPADPHTAELRLATLSYTTQTIRSTWILPPADTLRPHRLDGRPGITSAVFFDKNHLGLTWTDRAELLDARTGHTLATESWEGLSGGVAKMLAPDGPGAVVALTSAHLPNVPRGDTTFRGIGHYRRVARLGGELPRFVLSTTGAGLFLLEGDTLLELLSPRQEDLDVDGSLLASLGSFERVVHLFDLDVSPEPISACRAPDSQSVALLGPSSFDPVAAMLVSEPSGALLLDHDCHPLLAFATHDEPTILDATARHPEGPLFAVGLRDGGLTIWDSQGATRARLPAHAIAVRALEFSPDASLLVSGAWDGRLRFIALSRIFEPRTALAAHITTTWLGTTATSAPPP